MENRNSEVLLEAGESKRLFEIDHAERLLRMVNNGGWALPKDSKYEFVNDGLRLKKNTGASTKPA